MASIATLPLSRANPNQNFFFIDIFMVTVTRLLTKRYPAGRPGGLGTRDHGQREVRALRTDLQAGQLCVRAERGRQ